MVRVVALRGADVAEVLATADVVASAGEVAVIVADWVGDVVLLGAHQRRSSALAAGSSGRVLRRATGGVAVAAGDGTLYACLTLPEPSALVPCAMDRFLNRHLRGVLRALTKMGMRAHYMGRDFVSVLHRPAVWVGWDRNGSGGCRLELIASVSRSFALPRALDGYGRRERPPLSGKEPITLVDVSTTARDASEIRERLVERLPAALVSFPESLGGSGQPTLPLVVNGPSQAERLAVEARVARIDALAGEDDGDLVWSRPVEDAIGFVEAGVRLRADGSVARARVCGDFYAERGGMAALEGALCGLPPSPDAFGAAIDGAFGPGRYVIEGLATLRSIQSALLDAADRARSS